MVSALARGNPERIAWAVVLTAFAVLVTTTTSAVLGARWWLRSATEAQAISMTPSGTVLVTQPGRAAAEVNLASFPAGSRVATDATAQASLSFIAPGGREVLATVRMFGNTEIEVLEAASPRFGASREPHRIVLYVSSGRVRVNTGLEVTRAVLVEVHSEPGVVTTLNGSSRNASVEATRTQTMVTVRDGMARVTANGVTLELSPDERSVVLPGQPPSGPLTGEQNWIVNGDFAEPLDSVWQRSIASPADPNEQPGTAEIVTLGGRPLVQISRTGQNWGRAGVTQVIDRDVQGYSSLRLNLDVQIVLQDVRNCGVVGTECPLMVRLNYVDVGGGSREWIQGFYYFHDDNLSLGLTYCALCAVRFQHLLWPQAQWRTHLSDNLLEIFAAAGTPAARIEAITIYGEGHSFNSYVTDVQLLASE
jgi:hypothetical protein